MVAAAWDFRFAAVEAGLVVAVVCRLECLCLADGGVLAECLFLLEEGVLAECLFHLDGSVLGECLCRLVDGPFLWPVDPLAAAAEASHSSVASVAHS